MYPKNEVIIISPTVVRSGRQRMVDQVVDTVREIILNGEFSPGEHLVQEVLADRLGVSRTPLREALRVLEEEGLIVLSDNQGVCVVPVTYSMARDYYFVRESLDGLAARLAAQRGNEQDFDDLETILKQMTDYVKVWNPDAWLRTNLAFHSAVSSAAHNDILARHLDGVIQVSARLFFPTIHIHRDRAQEALREHCDIVDAIRQRDGSRAEALARLHIRTARELLAASQSQQLIAGD